MKPSFLILCALLAPGVALGDPYVIAKGQAKRDVNQSNAQQGIAPAQPNQPAPPQAAPVDPVLAATLQNIAGLRADFAALNNATGAKAMVVEETGRMGAGIAYRQCSRSMDFWIMSFTAPMAATLA